MKWRGPSPPFFLLQVGWPCSILPMTTLKPTKDISSLTRLMQALRDPETGCPWDKVQTFETIAPSTIEEAYEVSAAIDEGAPDHIREELGDLLFQVAFHSRIAEERGLFDFGDVVEGIVAKMIHRHPHVFGDQDKPKNAAQQVEDWEALKKRDRAAQKMRILDDVALALPALMRAVKLQKRASKVGFDWNNADLVIDKLVEEAREVVDAKQSGEPQERVEEEFGDLLFVMANLARHLKVDPEQALRRANDKFTRRFNYIEDNIETKASSMEAASLEDMEALWQEAKAAEHAAAKDKAAE